ncbi:MAG: ABC transporter ATP-binding protein, partial [Huintestinicola sp.]
HNLNSALKTGTRTIMMDSGKVILDICDKEREGMTLNSLLEMYSKKSNKQFDNDRMLLTR